MTRFVTIAGPDSGEFSGKPVMLNSDVRAWVAAGRPPLNGRQLGALCRTLAYGTGQDPEEVVQLAKATRVAFLLSQPPASPPSPSRTPGADASARPTKSGRTAGNPPKGKKARKAWKRAKRVASSLAAGGPISTGDVPFMMAGADPELIALWREQMTPEQSRAAGVDPDEATIMLHAEPQLRALWLAQAAPSEPQRRVGPLGMDQERYQLHTEAKQLAEQKLARDPRLDEGEAYILAVTEIEDRKFAGPI
jgi:hypothetical protein